MSAYESYLYRARHRPVQSHRLSICQPGRKPELMDSQSNETMDAIREEAARQSQDVQSEAGQESVVMPLDGGEEEEPDVPGAPRTYAPRMSVHAHRIEIPLDPRASMEWDTPQRAIPGAARGAMQSHRLSISQPPGPSQLPAMGPATLPGPRHPAMMKRTPSGNTPAPPQPATDAARAGAPTANGVAAAPVEAEPVAPAAAAPVEAAPAPVKVAPQAPEEQRPQQAAPPTAAPAAAKQAGPAAPATATEQPAPAKQQPELAAPTAAEHELGPVTPEPAKHRPTPAAQQPEAGPVFLPAVKAQVQPEMETPFRQEPAPVQAPMQAAAAAPAASSKGKEPAAGTGAGSPSVEQPQTPPAADFKSIAGAAYVDHKGSGSGHVPRGSVEFTENGAAVPRVNPATGLEDVMEGEEMRRRSSSLMPATSLGMHSSFQFRPSTSSEGHGHSLGIRDSAGSIDRSAMAAAGKAGAAEEPARSSTEDTPRETSLRRNSFSLGRRSSSSASRRNSLGCCFAPSVQE